VQLLHEDERQIAANKETHLNLRRFIPAVFWAIGTEVNTAEHSKSLFQR
jgi:hypothetical protein